MITDDDFNSRFIDLLDLHLDCYTTKFWGNRQIQRFLRNTDYASDTKINLEPDIFKLAKEPSDWCKEHKIRYKKIKVYKAVFQADGNTTRIGGYRIGLLFYTAENALAFKLRWG